MGMCGIAKNYTVGNSRAMRLPPGLKIGTDSTFACNRIILSDPRGEIDAEDLLEFLESVIEPRFWEWWEKKKAVKAAHTGSKKEGPEPSSDEERKI